MLNGKDTIIRLIFGLIKKHSINVGIFSGTKIFSGKRKSCIRLILLCNKSRFKKCSSC